MLLRIACLTCLAAGLSAQPQQHVSSPSSQPGYRIAGAVVNAVTGQPLAAVSVAIAPVTPAGTERDIAESVSTGADGRFSFAGLGRGKYSLMAAAHGYTLQYFDHHEVFASSIAVGPDLDAEHLVFRLQPDASVEGQVIDENNDPVQYASVRLFEKRIADGKETTEVMNQRQTDDQGRYHLGHLSPGTYYLSVSARPWYARNEPLPAHRQLANPDAEAGAAQEAAALDVTYPLTFYPDSSDWAGASPLVLHPGERATADVVLRAVPALHVRIRTGGPSAGRGTYPRISQRLFDGSLDSVLNSPMWFPEPGVVEIGALAPGHYVIEMPGPSGSGQKDTGRGWYQEIDLTGDTELTPGDAASYAAVSGFVLFEDAPGVPKDTSIQLENVQTSDSVLAEISAKGQFEFGSDAVRPGRYNVLLRAPQNYFLSKLSASGARLAGRTLEITGAATVRIGSVASRGVGQVDGVALRDDKPSPGTMIVLVPQDPGNNVPLFRRDQSDSDGTFTLSKVLPGHYTVVAIANGWDLPWANPAALQPYLKGGEAVQVTGSGKLQIKVQVQDRH